MGKPAQLAKAEIDAIVYECRQSGKDTTYDIVNLALARAGIAAPTADRIKELLEKHRTYNAFDADEWPLRFASALLSEVAAPAAAVQPSEQSAVLTDVRKWIVKNRPAITLSRQATVDEYLYLLKRIDAALAAATPEQKEQQ